ncbi:MAG: galactose-1-phosphate uridylyltransferase [Nitrospirae bacterium]|nr:galactose-1-phosphate uridylyltransferase [Nitrospirota bacterium]
MPELRLNLIANEWVVIATERAKKPADFKQWREKKYQPEYSDTCPFCAGNEAKTPSEVLRIGSDGSWKIRVIPNKLSVVSPEGEHIREHDGLRRRASGVGRHEIIVESPVHNAHSPLLPVEDVADIISAYRNRFIDLYKDTRVEHVIVFKNHGEGSGTTIQHPHSQIVGTPVIPVQMRDRVEEAARYYNTEGKCLMCATIEDELKDGRRIILSTDKFVSFIPYAAFSPFHTWIFPKRHMATFSDIDDSEMQDLALVLKATLLKLYHGLDNPDFNYVIRSEEPDRCRSKQFHWYISIVPRLSQASGFALGSGMYINPSIPEEVADFMRSVKEY